MDDFSKTMQIAQKLAWRYVDIGDFDIKAKLSNDKMQESCYPNYVRGYARNVPKFHGYGK